MDWLVIFIAGIFVYRVVLRIAKLVDANKASTEARIAELEEEKARVDERLLELEEEVAKLKENKDGDGGDR